MGIYLANSQKNPFLRPICGSFDTELRMRWGPYGRLIVLLNRLIFYKYSLYYYNVDDDYNDVVDAAADVAAAADDVVGKVFVD